MLKVLKYTLISPACPTQYEGLGQDGEEIYIRYRWGTLELLINGKQFYCERLGNNSLSEYISLSEIQDALKYYLDFSSARYIDYLHNQEDK